MKKVKRERKGRRTQIKNKSIILNDDIIIATRPQTIQSTNVFTGVDILNNAQFTRPPYTTNLSIDDILVEQPFTTPLSQDYWRYFRINNNEYE